MTFRFSLIAAHLGCCILIFLFLTQSVSVQAQKKVRLGFYNCENLLDTIDNPNTRDDEFTPNGMKRWNTRRFYDKINKLSKAIMSLGEWDGVDILALAEIENRKVIADLLHYSPLRNAGYSIVHFDSPDGRGIDVALIYKPKAMTLVATKAIKVDLPTGRSTRDILHVKALMNQTDTLHIFVNHWPSRWGGQINSEPRRVFVANVLKNYIDKQLAPTDKIVILGDMNDGPKDKSVFEVLNAKHKSTNSALVNLMLSKAGEEKLQTHAYQGVWEALDQIIVSRNLLDKEQAVHIRQQRAHVHKPDFMLIERDGVTQVLRSFRGARYEGGFSDHLPIYIDLEIKK